MNRIISAMSTGKAINISGFCAGFIWTIGPTHNLLEAPLSTTFVGAIGGTIGSMGADLVSGFLPTAGIPVLVGALTGSAILYGGVNTYKSYKIINKDLSSMFPSR